MTRLSRSFAFGLLMAGGTREEEEEIEFATSCCCCSKKKRRVEPCHLTLTFLRTVDNSNKKFAEKKKSRMRSLPIAKKGEKSKKDGIPGRRNDITLPMQGFPFSFIGDCFLGG